LVELDAFVVMPNHMHGIIVIRCRGEASAITIHVAKTPSKPDASPLRQHPNGTQPGSLPAIVQNFKSISTQKMNAASGALGTPVWQRNYYEHVVRNEEELEAIREYILGNPALLKFRR
jgi:REP element-mobilizing transposase RayT